MRVLLTGATGAIGSRLLPRLEREGHEVRALARNPERLPARIDAVEGDVLTGAGLDAALEGAEAAVATSSGMAAVTTILLSLMRAGDHLLAGDCLYGGTHDFLTGRAADLGWSVSFVDAGRPETWAAARTERTKVFLVETITNPLMRVGRLDQVADFGRREGIVTVIDNTFASPVNFRPLDAGFDVVFHSATKYLGGHSDLVAGAVMGSAELVDRVRRTLNHYGGSLDPHAGFLLARGIKTLALRVRAQNENAAALAGFLDGHPQVAAV
ncbi:MAG TPA: PLP-dependent transferase, partial [Solirubrobacteraceae bacterium]|nr:PLP-dependent transferase [Solirubrobacteraceae bacterium]